MIKFRTSGSNVISVNESGLETICYCWIEIPGYSKFGSYVGAGAASQFVYTGFKPAFVMTKESDHSVNKTTTTQNYANDSNAGRWIIYDNANITYNGLSTGKAFCIFPNSDAGYQTFAGINFLSNGFELTTTDSETNESGQDYIFIAFAEQPFELANAR